jgi:hypothetical protein
MKKLILESLAVESFDTCAPAAKKGTVYGEQCTCGGPVTCAATCPVTCDDNTCVYTCDDATCVGITCGYASCGTTCDQSRCGNSCHCH